MKSFTDKVADESQAGQFSQSQSQMVSTKTCDQTFNKNIEALKKIHKSEEMFNEIYETLNRITTENDFNAMDFAVKEKFCNVKNKYYETILDFSIEECNLQLARFIIEFGGKSNYICAALRVQHFDVRQAGDCILRIKSDFVRLILKVQHFDVNQALILASKECHHEVVKLFLTVPGIDVNAKDSDNETALIWASIIGYLEVVKLLLAVPGIDVNAKDSDNYTALIYASDNGDHEVVKLLLKVPEIDVNAKNNYNKTALIYASWIGHHEVVKLLLTVPGIDINAKDNYNKTALIYASSNGHHEVVKLLLTVPGIDRTL